MAMPSLILPSTSPDKPQGKSAATGDEQITVFHDPDNFNVKHPLMHKWTLWFTKPPTGKVDTSEYNPTNERMLNLFQGDNWNELLKEIITFNSVEEFWGVYV
jgi:translation initiation factor 4E